jgi:hypothetical protein
MTRQHVMSRREATLRRRVAQIIDASARQVLA